MKTVTATYAANLFGQPLDATQPEPVTVTKRGRPAAVMLSVEDYERIRGAARWRLLATLEQALTEAAAAGLMGKVVNRLLADQS